MEINEHIKQLEKELISPIIDVMTQAYVSPPNLLIPATIWKEKKREELLALFSCREDLEKIDSAVKALSSDFSSRLSPVEIEKLGKEWEKGVEKFNELTEKPVELPIILIPPIPLRKIMDLSESTIELFYSAGMRYLQNQDYVKAADIFFFLSLIDFQKHNIWVSLGLSQMKLEQFEPALNAFAMASITNSESIYPYLYSAECCIALQRFQESSTYLALAKEALGKVPSEEKESVLERINNLEQKSKF